MAIRIECKGADVLPIDAIEEFQGNLKKRTKKDIDQIITSIEKYGFSFPFFIWKGTGHNLCLDGHGRIQALAEMRRRGEDLPLFPVVYVDAKDDAEAKQKLLRLNSQYGQMTIDSVLEFADGIELDTSEIQLPGSKLVFGSSEESKEATYTQKYEIVIPCENEIQQEEVYNELTERGIKCRLSTL